jgi:hypothetical protein
MAKTAVQIADMSKGKVREIGFVAEHKVSQRAKPEFSGHELFLQARQCAEGGKRSMHGG